MNQKFIENEYAKSPIDKLTWAAYCGNLIEIEKYLKLNIDINGYDRNGETPLIVAIENAEYETVNYLLKKGANPNKRTLSGESPIERFINLESDVYTNGFELTTETIELLFENGADFKNKDESNKTALDLAIERKHFKAEKKIKELLNNSYEINKLNEILLKSCLEGNLNEIKNILIKGADINFFDDDFDTPLTISLINGNIEVIENLIKNGADVNKNVYSCLAQRGNHTCCDIPFTPPLHYAVLICSYFFSINKFYDNEIVELLIQNGAKLNENDWKMQTALDIAIEFKNYEVANFLKNIGAKTGTNKEIIHNIKIKKMGRIKE